ncbi:FAD-dependent oxidoreductase [Muricoccus radiodurans]|uniref:FAD-dependent oxidoreductase n=1 Tax=Muricoccus radiodurans TaxID=2231721 RepID=UPI003CF07832
MPDTDIAVIGAGRAGREIAALSALLGLRVALFERGPMGGDGPVRGRVAASALLACAHRAAALREAGRFGLPGGEAAVDWNGVRARIREAMAEVAPDGSAARFEGMGIEVVPAAARFAGPQTLAAGGREWRFRRCVVAAGGAPVVPGLPGLETIPYLTEETILALQTAPEHLIVLGGGAFGLEMAQAHALLGCRVTLVEPVRIALGHSAELAEGLLRALRADGVTVLEGYQAARVEHGGPGVMLALTDGTRVEGSHLLLALGRSPALAGLDLAAAGVAFGPGGIAVGRGLRSTTNRRVWAVGGIADAPDGRPEGAPRAGGGDVALVLRTMLFRLPGAVPEVAPMRSVRTEPGLVSLGADAFEAEDGRTVRLLRWPLADTGGAAAEGVTLGLVRLVADRRGRLLGAGLLAPRAAELAGVLAMAVQQGMRLDALAELDLPSPSLAEAIRQAAREFYTPVLSSAATRRIVRLTTRLP